MIAKTVEYGKQCRRTTDIADALKKKGLEDCFHKKTGLKIDAYFSATKIKWILDNVKGARELANEGKLLFGTVETWLIWKLTDSRSFLSYPRHEYFRRLLCNLLGNDVEKGLLPSDMEALSRMVEDISYNNARNYFKFY